jgi:hypothetical protein
MIVVVCGSRDWASSNPVRQVARIASRLAALPGEHEDITIIHGACGRKDPVSGAEVSADMLAEAAGLDLGFTVEGYPAEWHRFGRGAGPRRNREMLDRCPDLVLAFQRNGSRGTQDTIDEARRRGIAAEVHEA